MVCLGDSFTEGMADVLRPDGHHVGWSDRVALGLARADLPDLPAPIAYANLAVRGKLLDQVVAEQMPAALAMRPDLVTFHAGANDVLRPGVDRPALMGRYEAAVEQLVATGARVVLFTSLTRAGGSGRFADRLEERFLAFNRTIRVIADRLGCTLVDDEAVLALTDRRFWAVDRLHLNALGHARVAANVLASLGVTDEAVLGGPPGWWAEPLPPPDPVTRREALATDAEWVRAHLVPWVGRRVRGVSSGDGRDPKDPVLRTIVG
jgi:lysophospholipase L1-like esterase